jgi:hypothetical protein
MSDSPLRPDPQRPDLHLHDTPSDAPPSTLPPGGDAASPSEEAQRQAAETLRSISRLEESN